MTYDRWFLLGEKRNELLALQEVEQYGRDSFGDPDYVSIYGLPPREWYARGVRILGRTAVECTRDRLASRIGRDVAAVTRTGPAGSPLVIDLFAGSANTLHWIAQHVRARRAIGFELDDAVFALTRANLSAMGLDIDLRRTQPPVADVADVTTGLLGQRKLLFAIQVFETVEPGSLAELTARFPWFSTMIYDLNIPGQNAGLLLATHGWTPA
jgi:hypothetical protein